MSQSIRDIIGWAVGKKIVDITQQDREEYARTKQSYVQIMLDNGGFLKFPVGPEGFQWNRGREKA